MLKVRNLVKKFTGERTIVAIDGITFEVNEDEFLCIVGPSGCGKSTLLRIIAGIEKWNSGEVLFHDKLINGPNEKIMMIFQHFGLLPWKTALENVELPLEVHGIAREEARKIAMEYLQKVGLGDFADAYPHDLSGGMKQRVGIARALAMKPEILLMDEPFSSLDELTASTLRREVLRIWADPKLPTHTFIMVSHNVTEAVFMADRVLVMSARPGKIVEEVKVDIPRPRVEHTRDPRFFDIVDHVISVIEAACGGKARGCENVA
ncbi:MAG: ABC transporter ATP-binding protein [Thermoproteota archaeon]